MKVALYLVETGNRLLGAFRVVVLLAGRRRNAASDERVLPRNRSLQPWQELARKKRDELEIQMARLKAIRRAVDRVLTCECADLSGCGRIAASVIEATAK